MGTTVTPEREGGLPGLPLEGFEGFFARDEQAGTVE